MTADAAAPDRDGRLGAHASPTRSATLLALLAHPNIASQGGDDPPLRPRDPAAAPSCARSSASRADAPGRRRRARRPARHARHRHRHRRQPVVRPARPRGDGPRRRRRGDPQRRRRRRRPRPGRPARQLLVGRPAPARSTLGELVAAVDGCCDAAVAHRRAVRVRQGLAEQRVHRRRRPAPRRAADAGDHRRRPRARRRPHASRPSSTAPGNVLVLLGAHRVPSSPAATSTSCSARPADAGAVPQPDPDAPARYRRLHAAIRAGLVQSCHDVSEGGLAVALAEMCIAGRLGADDRAAAPRTTWPRRCSPSRPAASSSRSRPDDLDRLRRHRSAADASVLGAVTATPTLASVRGRRADRRRRPRRRVHRRRRRCVSRPAGHRRSPGPGTNRDTRRRRSRSTSPAPSRRRAGRRAGRRPALLDERPHRRRRRRLQLRRRARRRPHARRSTSPVAAALGERAARVRRQPADPSSGSATASRC